MFVCLDHALLLLDSPASWNKNEDFKIKMAAEEIRRLSSEGQYEALAKYFKEHSDAVVKMERTQRESLLILECCQHSLAWLAVL